jgi:hypothetical protein
VLAGLRQEVTGVRLILPVISAMLTKIIPGLANLCAKVSPMKVMVPSRSTMLAKFRAMLPRMR